MVTINIMLQNLTDTELGFFVFHFTLFFSWRQQSGIVLCLSIHPFLEAIPRDCCVMRHSTFSAVIFDISHEYLFVLITLVMVLFFMWANSCLILCSTANRILLDWGFILFLHLCSFITILVVGDNWFASTYV